MSTHREVMEAWFRRVWAEEDTTAIDEMFVPDGEARGLGANILIGPAGFRQFHSALLQLLSDIKITIDKSIDEGDWLSVVCSLSAKDRRSGSPVEMTGSVLIRIVDDKILEAYNHWDFLGMFGQLGLLPLTAFETALSGKNVC